MTDSGVIDPEALDRLKEWGGERLLGQMLRLFLENSAERMNQIRAGVDQDDLQEAGRGAHSLKSSAANVGAVRVRSLSAEIEEQCNDGNREGFLANVPLLEKSYASACAALAAVEKDLPE